VRDWLDKHPRFAKYSGSLIGARDPIHRPAVSTELDWEAELGVVIGRAGRNVSPNNALQHVAGYTIMPVSCRGSATTTSPPISPKTSSTSCSSPRPTPTPRTGALQASSCCGS